MKKQCLSGPMLQQPLMKLVYAKLIFFACMAVGLSAPAADCTTQMLEATYKLSDKAGSGAAMGFFVRPPASSNSAPSGLILVTAAHVFEHMSGEDAIVVLRQANADGTYTRRDFAIKVRAKSVSLWTAHSDLDIAALRVELPSDAAVSAIPFEALATEQMLLDVKLHLGSPVQVLAYPTGFESNASGFPVARHASVASFPLTPVKAYKTFLADFPMFNGDSGGPVFLADPRCKDDVENAPPLIIGLVSAQIRFDEKVETLNENRIVHYPLELTRIMHAHYIRETIEHLPK